MNKDNAKDFLPLVQALADGKTIQYLDDENEWIDEPDPLLTGRSDWYRIKPEPRTYELMRSVETGNVYDLSFNTYQDNGLWERITVQEVLP